MMTIQKCVFALVSLSALATYSLGAGKADIIKRGKSATVLVEHGRQSGTGFCVHKNGLFVTNNHVVADVADGGEVTLTLNSSTKEEKKIKATVVRKDKDADLALLKTLTKQDDLVVLNLGNSDTVIETSEVMAFGFPLGKALSTSEKESPAISITMGRVNSLRKKEGKLWRIQLDAVLTPGNSGGPVLDKNGEVVGIVVSGVLGLGLNFSVPVNQLKAFLGKPIIHFEPPTLTPENLSRSLPYKVTLTSLAPNSSPFKVVLNLKVGTSEQKLELEKSGEVYIGKSAILQASDSNVMRVRLTYDNGLVTGRIKDSKYKIDGDIKRFSDTANIDLGEEPGVELVDGKVIKGTVSGLREEKISLGKYYPRLDLSKARQIQFAPLHNVSEVGYKLTITSKETTYALEGEIDIEGAEDGAPQRLGSDKPGTLAALPDVSADPLDKAKVLNAPSSISNCIPGGGGRYLVLEMKKVKKLAILSVAKGKFIKYISLPSSEIFYAVGRTKLIVVLPSTGIISRYSLASGKREITKKIPITGMIQRIAMGMNCDGPLLVRWAVGSGALDRASYALLDINRMNRIDSGNEQGVTGHNSSYRDRVFLRPSADGTTFGVWATSHSPSGLGAFIINGKNVTRHYEHDSVGTVLPGPKGQYLYTSRGVFNSSLKQVMTQLKSVRSPFMPSLMGNYFIGLSNKSQKDQSYHDQKFDSFNLYMKGDGTPLVQHEFPEEVGPLSNKNGFSQTGDFTIERRVNFVPEFNRIVYIPSSDNKVVLEPFDVLAVLNSSGIDYLYVSSSPETVAKPGKTFKYKMQVMSKSGGVSFHLESGPEGMKVSKSGTVYWRVPQSFSGSESVIILVKDKSDQEIFHTFSIAAQ